MGMATSICLGTDSSWLKVEIAQIILEQVRKYIFFCTPSVDMPPITACPWINGTMECLKSGSGRFGPRNCCENISLDKKYFYIIYSTGWAICFRPQYSSKVHSKLILYCDWKHMARPVYLFS